MTALRRAKPTETDAELLDRIARGDVGALGELYDRHQQSVRRFLGRVVTVDVDDLVQATFLEAAKSAGRYDGRSSSSRPWLIGIAVRLSRRRRSTLARLLSFLSSLEVIKVEQPRLDDRADIETALQAISEAKRMTFLMAEVEGMTGPEIAEALNVPIGTVWTRLHSARRELRALLEDRE